MDTLSYKTLSVKPNEIKKDWFIVDATDLPLGRLASEIAIRLRGKHKPYFTPHMDCGDCVIVINAEKVKLTGKKMTNKVYLTYSGYPGGQKQKTPREILEKYPERLIENAVRGMLPKNRLGRSIFNHMFVYAGGNHPHQAQKPQTLKF